MSFNDLSILPNEHLIKEFERRFPTMVFAGLSEEEDGRTGTFAWAGNFTTCIGLVYRLGAFLDEEGQICDCN